MGASFSTIRSTLSDCQCEAFRVVPELLGIYSESESKSLSKP